MRGQNIDVLLQIRSQNNISRQIIYNDEPSIFNWQFLYV